MNGKLIIAALVAIFSADLVIILSPLCRVFQPRARQHPPSPVPTSHP